MGSPSASRPQTSHTNKTLAAMASSSLSMPSKWFSNKSFQLGHRRRSSSNTKAHSFEQVFRSLDSDGDGKISSEELRSFMSAGEAMSTEEAEEAIKALDSDGDGMVDYGDFVHLMKGGCKDGDDNSGDQDLRRAFEMFELEKGSGSITPRSLQRMLGRLGDVKSYKECKSMIRAYDLDGNGVLDYQEFQSMMA